MGKWWNITSLSAKLGIFSWKSFIISSLNSIGLSDSLLGMLILIRIQSDPFFTCNCVLFLEPTCCVLIQNLVHINLVVVSTIDSIVRPVLFLALVSENP